MSEYKKKTCKYLNYVEHWIILVSAVTSCVSISAFASLVCDPVGIATSAVGIKMCKSVIKKKKKKHNKILLLGKTKLNTIEVLISKALIDSYIRHDEFVSVNVLTYFGSCKKKMLQTKIQVLEKQINAFIKLCCLRQEKISFY